MTMLFVPVCSLLAAAALGVSAGMGAVTLGGVVAVLVVLSAVGWPTLVGQVHARRGSAVVIAVSGLLGVALALFMRDKATPLAPFAGLLAGCLLMAFIHQMLRRDGRADLVQTLTATVSGLVVAVLAAGWILLPQTGVGSAGLVVGAVAAAVASVVVANPVDPLYKGWIAFAVAAVIAVIAAAVWATNGLMGTALVGVAVAAVAAGHAMFLQSLPAVRVAPPPWLAVPVAGIAPMCVAGTVAYAVARLAGG